MGKYVLVKKDTMESIADSVRSKLGVSDAMTPSEIADGVQALPGIVAKAFFEGTLTEFNDPDATSVRTGFFASQTTLTKVSMPNAETIGQNAFFRLKNVTQLDFPSVKVIEFNAFYGFQSASDFEFPEVVSLKGRSFEKCDVGTLSFPKLVELDNDTSDTNGAFFNAYVKAINVPNLEIIKKGGFNGIRLGTSSSIEFSAPKLKIIDAEMPDSGWSSKYTFHGDLVEYVGRNVLWGVNSVTGLYLPSIRCDGAVVDGYESYTNGLHASAFSSSYITEIHFAAANQASIEADSGYATLWGRGAGNATVYFDL